MTMRKAVAALAAFVIFAAAAEAAEIHVAVNGKDDNPGTPAAPLRTIQRAADLARPGDVVTVHAGVYRERISPPRGGESDADRIVYQAAPGEKVEIKGSEVVKGWVTVEPGLWKVTVPNSLFGAFNPFSDLIRGDWFEPKGRDHHTGAVYLDGEWLAEAAAFEDLMKPGGPDPLWFAKVDSDRTTIWAEFKNIDPNEHLTEVNVRQTVFYPEKNGIDYITVRGFVMRHAATNWAPPTAEQVGLIGTNWSKGWVIEKNTISHSTCSGIALGKHGDEFDNTSKDTAEGYVRTIERALARGWSKDRIGGHIVRDNAISHCEQTGIVGSMGAAFSTITGNTIHDIHVRQLFTGAEMAGIKLHAAIDVVIGRNHIYRAVRGLWLDWMAQGTRVTGNLFHDNPAEDLFMEVDHGPFLVDNNVFLSPRSVLNVSQGGAYVHNLMAGEIRVNAYDARQTPFHKAHSTELLGMHDNPFGDDKFFNNVFAGRPDLGVYDKAPMPVRMEGNVFLAGAKPSSHEREPVVKPAFEPGLKVVEKPDGFYLELIWEKALGAGARRIVTTALIGKAAIPDLPYEQADGKAVRVDIDFFGKRRRASNPTPGPFEDPGEGRLSLKVW
jgi:alpha-N-arabinofuranosidase